MQNSKYISVPVKEIGPIKINGIISGEITVPLATYETPLWASTNRGARISRKTNGINVCIIKDCMTRSVILQGNNINELNIIKNELINYKNDLQKEITKTSNFAELTDIHCEIIGNLIYIRFEFNTKEASGHNMVTKASDKLIDWICNKYSNIKYVSISGNICVDKKTSAINGILGRGKYVIAEINIPKNICIEYLKVTPENIVELNIKKNLIGSILAGSIRSANAHYANILSAFYLAVGQDVANIVEGSQGITYAKINSDGSLYFSINCPNIIVGTIGNGKNYDFVQKYLKNMNCLDNINTAGENSKKLACIIAATILCSELSLLASQINKGELVKAHDRIERKSNK